MTIYKSDVIIKFDWIMDSGVYPKLRDLLKPTQDVEVRLVEDEEYSTYMLFLLNEKIGEVQSWNFERLDSLINANTINSSQISLVNKNEILVRFEIVKDIDDIEIPKLANGNGAGIYKISINNGSCLYIGQSRNINRRIKTHWASLIAGDHHNVRLQGYFQKYGKESAHFETVELVQLDMRSSISQQRFLEERERFWIKHFRESDFIVVNATEGDYVETKETVKETKQNKKISALAYDLRISAEKAKIKNEIEFLKAELLGIEKKIKNENNRIEPIRLELATIQEQVRNNSGFLNRLFSSISRFELNTLINEETSMTIRVDNESKELRGLLNKEKEKTQKIKELINRRNKLRSSRQMENAGLSYRRTKVDPEKYFDVKNCVFSYKCKKNWDELTDTSNEKIKFCADCNKHVYHVEDLGGYLKHMNLGECVAAFPEVKSKTLSLPTLGLPADYQSPSDDDVPF